MNISLFSRFIFSYYYRPFLNKNYINRFFETLGGGRGVLFTEFDLFYFINSNNNQPVSEIVF